MSIQRKVLRKTPNTEKALEILLGQPSKSSLQPAFKLSSVLSSPPQSHNDKPKPKKDLAIPDRTQKFIPTNPNTLPKSSLLTSKDTTTSNAPEYDEEFGRRLKANPYANMLASPIRMDKLRWTAFPRDLLIPFGFEEGSEQENISSSSSSEQENFNETLADTLDPSKEDTSNRIMLQPRVGKEYLTKAGSTAYIPCHQSSVDQLVLQWRGFFPVVLTTSVKSAHSQFQSSVLRASQQQHQEQTKKSKKSSQPPAVFPQDLASGLIPTLFVDDIIRILQKKVLKHHLVRLQIKPLPQETPYFFRLSWEELNEPTTTTTNDTTLPEFCTQVFNIPEIMKTQQEHSETLYKILSESVPKFKEQKYIDIPSHIGIDIHKFLIKYIQYFSEL
ncbi:uncharacterized protein SAPINGB_P000915 [Magnusiomyces paraingens]|uniref:Uncharacterized protein n=1 Tax=Magnusiomyces paraingens TaxID=2606893 RepID=A0A5E8B2Z6_9ASCO|nr:uncharacterized protein SAPINGB_P000915 [Saprochaete ingens]VVT45836.1 unnamed protein product [Saprochaete ingens]